MILKTEKKRRDSDAAFQVHKHLELRAYLCNRLPGAGLVEGLATFCYERDKSSVYLQYVTEDWPP